MLDAVIFNILIGNNDAHGKNFSFLYAAEGSTLAPLYDLSSTVAYPALSTSMAMKIGGTDKFEDLRLLHWEQFAKDTGLGPAQVRRRLVHLAHSSPEAARKVRGELAPAKNDTPILDGIVSTIEGRATKLVRLTADP